MHSLSSFTFKVNKETSSKPFLQDSLNISLMLTNTCFMNQPYKLNGSSCFPLCRKCLINITTLPQKIATISCHIFSGYMEPSSQIPNIMFLHDPKFVSNDTEIPPTYNTQKVFTKYDFLTTFYTFTEWKKHQALFFGSCHSEFY